MTRSLRRTPIVSVTTAETDKPFKALAGGAIWFDWRGGWNMEVTSATPT